MTPARRLVAYVLPVHNEAAGIRAFHESLVTATDKRPDLDFEFVYVDDGSSDESLDLLLELREADERVTVIALARNFGHQIAVTAGLDAAVGRDAVVVMDTDLQDPPEVSLQLIETWESGVDVAYAQRRTRRDSPFKKGTAYGLLLAADAARLDRHPAQRRRLPADGPAGGRGGRPLPRARPVPARDRGARRLPAGGRAVRPRPALRRLLVVPAAHDAEARGRRHPRLLDVPAAADLAAGHADLAAERPRRVLRGLHPAVRARARPCPGGRSSRSGCSCSAACSC